MYKQAEYSELWGIALDINSLLYDQLVKKLFLPYYKEKKIQGLINKRP